jgi:hypothetical protein
VTTRKPSRPDSSQIFGALEQGAAEVVGRKVRTEPAKPPRTRKKSGQDGRPRIFDGDTERVQIRLPKKQFLALKVARAETMLTESQIMSDALDLWLKDHKANKR